VNGPDNPWQATSALPPTADIENRMSVFLRKMSA